VGWIKTLSGGFLFFQILFCHASSLGAAGYRSPWHEPETNVRSAGLGGVHASQALPQYGVILQHANFPYPCSIETASLNMPLSYDWGMASLSFSMADFGQQQSVDAKGRVTGIYKVQGQAWDLGWGKSFAIGLSSVATLHGTRWWDGNTYVDVLSGYKAFSWQLHRRLSAGLGLELGTEDRQWVFSPQAGFEAELLGDWAPWMLLAQMDYLTDKTLLCMLGTEWGPAWLKLRAGWRLPIGAKDSNNQDQGLTLGAGLAWEDWALAYAWQSEGSLGSKQRVALHWKWEMSTPGDAFLGSGKAEIELQVPPALPNETPALNAGALLNAENAVPMNHSLSPLTRAALANASGVPAPVSKAAWASRPAESFAVMARKQALQMQWRHAVLSEPASQGVNLEVAGKLTEARHAYEACVASDENDDACWRGLGRLLGQTDNKTQAIAAWKKVLNLLPGDGEALAWLKALGSAQ
jgi:hypothetical protein